MTTILSGEEQATIHKVFPLIYSLGAHLSAKKDLRLVLQLANFDVPDPFGGLIEEMEKGMKTRFAYITEPTQVELITSSQSTSWLPFCILRSRTGLAQQVKKPLATLQ